MDCSIESKLRKTERRTGIWRKGEKAEIKKATRSSLLVASPYPYGDLIIETILLNRNRAEIVTLI
jgi:hypothetical protein